MSANFIDIADYSSAALRDILLLAHKIKKMRIASHKIYILFFLLKRILEL